MSVIGMKMLTRQFMREYDNPVLTMMFHSMEILPGKTPFVRSKLQQKMYLSRLEGIIRHLTEKDCVESSTLKDLYDEKLREIP